MTKDPGAETRLTEITITIQNKLGLHTRPAKEFVQTAGRFQCDIRVSKGGSPPVNGKSIMGLMSLLAPRGTEIHIVADGPDEAEALAALQALADNHFGDTE